MPPEFTLTALQGTVEAIAGRHVHKQNFRRGVERTGLVQPTGRLSSATGGRPAELFRVVDGDLSAVRLRVSRLTRTLETDKSGDTLVERTEVHRAALNQKPVKVSIGDPKSRWGSCSPHNRSIRYSWRVIMAPPAVIDYLAAHEVAHLVHADHSPAYWSVVQRLVGDHRPHRKWLRDNGPALHAVGR